MKLRVNPLYIILGTIICSILFSGISYLIFRDLNIFYGIFIGGICRVGGFNSINRFISRDQLDDNINRRLMVNYLGRMLFYIIIILICIDNNVNIIALAFGLLIMNIVIIGLSMIDKGGD